MRDQVVSNSTTFPAASQKPSLYGPLDTGPLSPLVLPKELSPIRAARLIECLRHIVTTGSEPSLSLFFQQNGPKERLRSLAKFLGISGVSLGVFYSVSTSLLTGEAISKAACFVVSGFGALFISALRMKKHAKGASKFREENRQLWGFSRETKDADIRELLQITRLALDLLPGLSQRIAARHRWSFDVASTEGRMQAANIVSQAIINADEPSILERDYQIDAGNARRYKDTALDMLSAAAKNLPTTPQKTTN